MIKTQITKLRNNTETVNYCANCRREIKHAFQVGTKIYGSECVLTLFTGLEKEVKSQVALEKAYLKLSPATIIRGAAIMGISEDQYFTRFITTGEI